MEITLNLNDNKRGLVNVPFQWPLKMPPLPQESFFKRQFRRLFHHPTPSQEPIELLVYIEKVKTPKEMVIDRNKLFTISYDGRTYPISDSAIRVMMTANEVPFSLYINTAAITDCSGKGESMQISAHLMVYDGNRIYGENPKIKEFKGFTPSARIPIDLDIRFAKIETKPIALLDINESVDFTRRDPLVKIGALYLKNDIDLSFVPEIVPTVHLTLYGPDHRKIEEALKLIDQPNEEGRILTKDVILDMNKISNPAKDSADYTIEFSGTYQINDMEDDGPKVIPAFTEQFELRRDTLGSKLQVTIDGKEIVNTAIGSGRHMLKQVNFTMGNDLTRPYKLVLDNLSSDDSIENAGVFIKRLEVEVIVKGVEKLLDKNGKDLTKDIIILTGSKLGGLKSNNGIVLKNGIGPDSSASLTLTFRPERIAKIEWDSPGFYLFTVICKLDFLYYENVNGGDIPNDDELKRFHVTLEQPAYLEPNPEWLCVDYGTSAIVTVYNGQVLDLHSRKNKIISSDENYKSLYADTLEPPDSLFLSSDIILNKEITKQEISPQESSLSSQQKKTGPYHNLAVCLSPTSSMIIKQFTQQIPCLKMLVGRPVLPPNSYYNIPYYYRKDDQIFFKDRDHILPPEDDSSLISVMNIFRESYHTLFSYFIKPEVNELEKLNKLVLTYPNAYTPRHLSLIRDLVKTDFPSIRMDNECLRFVSESDAVAAYYIRHWSEYHHAGASMDHDENILVFDMGAGTLDVSLMQKHSSQGNHELRINGKLGTCKAGNYLDFVIAKILCSLDPSLNPDIASTELVAMGTNERIEMKLAIKAQIKPQLSHTDSDEIHYTFIGKKRTVSRKAIFTHELFIQYLNESTVDMLDKMCHYLGCEKLEINTVLMSGRSCRLMPLQSRLREAVKQRNLSPNCEFIILDEPISPIQNDKDRQKTAVAQGAMIMADIFSRPTSPVRILSKRLYANYGIAYQEIGEEWKYVELLNHRAIPTNATHEEFQFDSHTITGLEATAEIKLIQSYLNEEETRACINQKQMDYISIMASYAHNSFNREIENGKLDVSIVLTENDEISLKLGSMQSLGHQPSGTDLENPVIQASFWPVKITS